MLKNAYPGSDLTPEQHIESLNNYESWYQDRGFDIPNKDWIDESREYWKEKKVQLNSY
jgi:hypothetical protein